MPRIIVKEKFFPKTAKIGILSGNEPAIKAAGDTAEAELKKAGYTIAQKTEINIVGQDTAAQLRDAQASVATMKAAGVDTVVVVVPFTVNSSFFDEANNSNAGFKYMLIDAASSLCTQFGASRVPAAIGNTERAVRHHVGHARREREERDQEGQRVRGEVPHDHGRGVEREDPARGSRR